MAKREYPVVMKHRVLERDDDKIIVAKPAVIVAGNSDEAILEFFRDLEESSWQRTANERLSERQATNSHW
jgi:hypothetical protein